MRLVELPKKLVATWVAWLLNAVPVVMDLLVNVLPLNSARLVSGMNVKTGDAVVDASTWVSPWLGAAGRSAAANSCKRVKPATSRQSAESGAMPANRRQLSFG